MKKDNNRYKEDDYTNNEETRNEPFHGTSAEIGSDQDYINPNGEIVHEEGPTPSNRSTNSVFDEEDEASKIVMGTEADISKEDIEALGPRDLSMDMADDEDLKHRVYPVDFAGEDLDIPGSELDDDQEDLGSEDEENNHYSRGQD